MTLFTPAQRQWLRAQAHNRKPVVIIGHAGLTEAVLREIQLALTSHELIKIRIFNEVHDEREAIMQQICTQLNAHPIQHIGKILTVYRAGENPKLKLPH